jgi:hypothetical protein
MRQTAATARLLACVFIRLLLLLLFLQAVAEALSSYSRLSHLERLRDRFEFKDPAGRDQGINVRQRAGAIVVLLNDKERLKEERDKVRDGEVLEEQAVNSRLSSSSSSSSSSRTPHAE